MIRLYFKKEFDKYKKGHNGFVERTLAIRLIENHVAELYRTIVMETAVLKVKKEKAVRKKK